MSPRRGRTIQPLAGDTKKPLGGYGVHSEDLRILHMIVKSLPWAVGRTIQRNGGNWQPAPDSVLHVMGSLGGAPGGSRTRTRWSVSGGLVPGVPFGP